HQGTNAFSGTLDEVRIYSRVLTLAEIQADRATPIAPPEPDTTPPSDVTGLTALDVSPTQINLSWAPATDNVGVTSYRVERCQGVSCVSFVQIATPAGTTFGDTSLTATTSYRYRVTAVDAANNVSLNYSPIATATTQDPPETTPPSDVTGLTALDVSPTQINLSWAPATDNVGVTGYRVERCQGVSCVTFVQIATPTGTAFGDTGLTATTSYRYRVTAVDAANNVSLNYSPIATATTPTPPPDTVPPTDPSGLTATASGSSQLTLAWTAATDNVGVTGYAVERCQGAGCVTFVQIATPVANAYSDAGLTPGTTYRYRVRATDAAGNLSAYTPIATGTTAAAANLITALGLNEGAGLTLADTSGTGHTGTLVNGPTWVAGQALYGQALAFDGLNDAVALASPDTYNFGTADFTIELWVQRAALGGVQRHLFSKCAATWVTGCKELYFKASNQLAFGSFATGDTLASAITDTNWHHVAVTFTDSTNTLRIYLDGALATTATKALEADGVGHVATLGNHQGTNAFSGTLDEVRIYSRVLTLAEIQADRATPIAPPPDTTPPSDVTGLTATAVSPTQINLSWAPATD
ncbi:MAG: LamG-like jellyroll fold domain-containing protein, partial [Nitrospiraceae bacterium]